MLHIVGVIKAGTIAKANLLKQWILIDLDVWIFVSRILIGAARGFYFWNFQIF